jgi:hypothetical protein
MGVYSISTVAWTSIASLAGVVKSSIASIAGTVTEVVLSWVKHDLSFWVECVEPIDGTTVIIARQSASINKYLISDNSLVSSYTPSAHTMTGMICLDGNYLYWGSYYAYNMRINVTDWSEVYYYGGGSHPGQPYTTSAMSCVIVGDSGGSGARWCNKSGSGSLNTLGGTNGATQMVAVDAANYAWCGCYYYQANQIWKISTGATPAVVATISLSYGACYIAYDPVNNYIWVSEQAGAHMTAINATTNAVVGTWGLSPICGGSLRYREGKLWYPNGTHLYTFDPITHAVTDMGQVSASAGMYWLSDKPALNLCTSPGGDIAGDRAYWRRQ